MMLRLPGRGQYLALIKAIDDLVILAKERLQIDTDLLRIITSTADELSVGTVPTLNDLAACHVEVS